MLHSTSADRRQLPTYLALHGPTHGPVLRVAMGWDRPRFWDVASGAGRGWFLLNGDGWSLTDRGRVEGVLPA